MVDDSEYTKLHPQNVHWLLCQGWVDVGSMSVVGVTVDGHFVHRRPGNGRLVVGWF